MCFPSTRRAPAIRGALVPGPCSHCPSCPGTSCVLEESRESVPTVPAPALCLSGCEVLRVPLPQAQAPRSCLMTSMHCPGPCCVLFLFPCFLHLPEHWST